ncbi:hypothetical protein HDV00_009332 [Rhizophlyctis rosea]|nr:hypothetical protein HDV00_009332 [Rhizophlyctis rosea]
MEAIPIQVSTTATSAPSSIAAAPQTITTLSAEAFVAAVAAEAANVNAAQNAAAAAAAAGGGVRLASRPLTPVTGFTARNIATAAGLGHHHAMPQLLVLQVCCDEDVLWSVLVETA